MGIDIEQCKLEAKLKGYDKPIFYFSFSTAAHPDSLHKVFREERRNALHKLIGQYGNWAAINTYYQKLLLFDATLTQSDAKGSAKSISKMQKATELLFLSYKDPKIQSQFEKIERALQDSSLHSIQPQAIALQNAYQNIIDKATPNQLLIPAFHWYGLDNQYHFWITNFLSGDFGTSNRDHLPVYDKIKTRLPWTLYLSIPAIILAYLLSIPLGVFSAVYKGSRFDRFTSSFLLLAYSLPVFWAGTMLVNFFTTQEFGMKIFPTIGLSGKDLNWENITRLILPILCLTYPTLAFITQQVRSSMLSTLQQDFIRTARAKGLTEQKVIWKHAFRNSLFPLITIFGAVLPGVFAGSVVIEFIFNITGMGWLMLDSIRAYDWPVVYTVLLISAVLTMLGLLIADILYVIADPRVNLSKK
jgi:peptide/nickel transport system permease protein